jgi:predicted phage terminase large subunit-like protein
MESLTQTMLRRIMLNPWIPKVPNPKKPSERGPTEKQMEFLLRDELEILYGGAAGGGKTWAILAAAAMYVDVPGYSAILFRNSFTDLELSDGLIPKSREWGWREKGALFRGDKWTWEFPTGDPLRPATVSFGYIGSSSGHLRYKSSMYQFIGFDQVEDIQEEQYLYLFSRLRRLQGSIIPIRMRSTANPGGEPWVYERFVQKETRDPGAYFISATVDENPYIDLTSYEESFKKLDPITYEQLRHGKWGLTKPGSMFLNKFNLVRQMPGGNVLRGVRYWDLAATDESEGGSPAYTAGALMLTSGNGLFYLRDVKRYQLRPHEVEALVAKTAQFDRALTVSGGYARHIDTVMEQEPGSSGVNTIDHYARNVLAGFTFRGDHPTGSKLDRARPFAAAVANGNVYLVLGDREGEAMWHQAFINECLAFPEGKYKDQVDAASGAFNQLSRHVEPAFIFG